jgi:hypothetical protein
MLFDSLTSQGPKVPSEPELIIKFCSNQNTFHLIKRNLIAGAVIKLCGLWAFVIGDLLGMLDAAAVFEVGGDAGCPEGVIANAVGQANGFRTSFNHIQCVACIKRAAAQRAMPVNRAEEGAFLFCGDTCR